ncbi:glycoside hydrolase family 3 protein [Aquibacillus saliphilus]|uniref:glycoside hydrolase family 3 protein n=1 Tax=Aquibacillus saliphilus TaxID=1909422 RepID=UPI001CEFBDDF|nr:glycoside hydrolase family 3 N-terminal domain-containing protein [Aquibacillus saliphilus]
MVNLKAKPYYLDDEGVKWVEETISKMTINEKIGQLFIDRGGHDEESLRNISENYRFGGTRYHPSSSEQVLKQNRFLQENSKIPMLIAANTESGGNGAFSDGTYIGNQTKIGATRDVDYAYEMGRISGIESAVVGCNWSFAPVVDIQKNWRNAVISNRVFADNPELVLEMSKAFMKGMGESGVACAMKHFPGDGIDERDQHLSNSVNDLSCDEWDSTFGKVYEGMIDAGVHSIMAGHIMLPAYSRNFNAQLTDEDMLPATLSKELITDLLKVKLGFNGMVITDASQMIGFTSAIKRSELLPASIAAGCDMFLFLNNQEEDFGYMIDGYNSGVITDERLHDALQRILGIKASLGLHKKEKKEIVPWKEGLNVIGSKEFTEIAKEISDKSITLVKDVGVSPLPLTIEKHKRVLLVPQKGFENPLVQFFIGNKGRPAIEMIKEELTKAGFEVTIYQSEFEKLLDLPKEEMLQKFQQLFGNKMTVAKLTEPYDLVIHVADVNSLGQQVQRINFQMGYDTPDIPWYVHEIPTIFVSVNSPFHLVDVARVKTYINTYDNKEHTMIALVKKLIGESDFKGESPVDAFCGLSDTRV